MVDVKFSEHIHSDVNEYIILLQVGDRSIEFHMPLDVLHDKATYKEDCSVTITRGDNDE